MSRRALGAALVVLGLLCLGALAVLVGLHPDWPWWQRGVLTKALQWGGAALLLAGLTLRVAPDRR